MDEPMETNNSNLVCKVCGEKKFEERDGFYYCLECGTKQDQIRHIELEYDEDAKKAKKQKIQVVKAEKPQLTSWECYNYILRGYVEELLLFSAKEDLKLMSLQVWAAYLRRIEVAFFNRKQPDLPKLGIIYLQNDAQSIYNHSKEARKKRKSKKSDTEGSGLSGNESIMSAKDYRKSKRKLDESIYSLTSASAVSGMSSSTSANSNRPIRLNFNNVARKYLKKKMPIKHLKRHESDADGLLQCHKQPKSREIKSSDYAMVTMSSKQIYCILAIALNLIEDDIQICDLLRFVHEGHIGPNNVLQYFPENIANNGRELLRNINYSKNPDKYADKVIREHIAMLCRNIGILKLKTPDIKKLVRRYVNELSLPYEIGTYVERLINLLPPQFDTRSAGVCPNYEARAMAYIIYVLKLLFGLDGDKEQCMSQASRKINRKIEQLNRKNNEKQQLLFVWSEWVEYIEMRKVIVSHFNPNFCQQFNQCQSTTQLLEQMAEEIRREDEQNNIFNDTVEHQKTKQRFDTFKGLFQKFQENFKNVQAEETKSMQYIQFKPTFTPGLSYFKSICLHCDNESSSNSETFFKIPDFMRRNHAERDVKSYLQVKPLIGYFKNHQKDLKAYVLPSNNNRAYVGVFRSPRALFRGIEHLLTRTQKASFAISENKWAESVSQEVVHKTDDLEFKSDLDNYEKRYFAKRRKAMNKKNNLYDDKMDYDLSSLHNQNNMQNEANPSEEDQFSIKGTEYSFNIFDENNMNPMPTKNFIKRPRRDLDKINIFDGISDEESVLNEADDTNEPSGEALLNCYDADTPTLQNQKSSSQESIPHLEEEFLDIKPEVSELEDDCRGGNTSRMSNKIPKDKSLKLYVSNMDCWMLLGNILMLTKGQKSQLQDKFPRSFNWLLETCAQSLNVEWSVIYEQLLTIELMFCMGIEDPKKIKNCVYMNTYCGVKDFQMLINNYREIW